MIVIPANDIQAFKLRFTIGGVLDRLQAFKHATTYKDGLIYTVKTLAHDELVVLLNFITEQKLTCSIHAVKNKLVFHITNFND